MVTGFFRTSVCAVVSLLVACSSTDDSRLGSGGDEDGNDESGQVGKELSSSSNTALATGWAHACTIFHGGKVVCWGANGSGQLGDGTTNPQLKPVLVSGITTATAVTTGQGIEGTTIHPTTHKPIYSHSCALLSDGTVRCWGRNSYGQLGNGTTKDSVSPVAVTGITNATAIAAGTDHTCARLSDSTVKCWGYNASGQLGNNTTTNSSTPVSVSGLSSATAIATGGMHSCARLSDSTLRCWGEGGSGRLGNASTLDRKTPVTVSGISNATAIAAGDSHTCALLSNSTVKCWGEGGNGQLGVGTTSDKTTPVTVSGISTATGIGLGTSHSCARLSNATLKCWGKNDQGQVGDGSTTQRNSPVTVSGMSTAVEVSGGTDFTCATLASGAIQCWGINKYGQVGQNTAGIHALPTVIRRLTLNKIASVAPGYHYGCAIWDSGSVKCWGENPYGQLGNGTTTDSLDPVDVTGITSAVEIASGEDHTCVRLTDSTIKCWGRGDMGQLGNGKFSNSSVPVAVTGVSTATQIGLGLFHSCARLSNSTLKCWGNNGDAELGMGSSCFFGGCSNQATPVTVNGISNAVAVQPGQWHTCALLSTGGVKCWGNNTVGQLGNGNFTDNPTPGNVTGLSNVTALDAGAQHNCAVLGDSSVKCWGNNDSGQLGNNTTTNSNVPVVASGISTATQVAGGANHSCAALSNKTVMCWGRNDEGQVGDGTIDYTSVPKTAVGVTATSQLATGPYGYHNCIRRDDSTMMCWGDNGVSRIGDGHVPNFTTPIQPVCSSVEVERSDYFIGITTANMPDPAFNGLAGQLDTHRVKPVFFPETCTAQQGMVLVHGRTVEAASAFDLQYQDYSFMEQLALAGVDTFAFNHLGLGRSSGFTAMTDACNAALPACLDIGQTCPPPAGVLCDCGPPPTFGVNDKNQQGSTRYLNPNPLTALCAHTTNTRFTNTTTMVADVDAAVDDALSKSGLSKVSLLGYSAGGIDVGNYLGTADNTARAAHTAKVDKAIFVSSLFGLPQVGATEPTGGSSAHSYPMGVMDRGSATAGGFNLDLVACPGQRDNNIVDPIWASVKARDSVGATWGPSQTPAENSGLSRFPHATRWGWDATAAARVSVPVLVMQGLRDNVVPVASSANLYNALTGTTSKTIVQVGCGSHSIFWEGCSGSQCNSWTGAHFTIKKNAQDWVQTGMIYASPGSANGSFGSTNSEGVNYHTDAPTEDGPAADEGNLLP